MTTESFEPSQFIYSWEHEDQTSYVLYLESRVLNIALARQGSARPIESISPSTWLIMNRIRSMYPSLSLSDGYPIITAVDRFIETQKLALKYMKVDPALMPRDDR